MALNLAHLDACTRRFMLAELDADLADGTIYHSPQLSEEGQRHYVRLLRDALLSGTDASFAEALSIQGDVRPVGRWQHAAVEAPVDARAAASALLAERE